MPDAILSEYVVYGAPISLFTRKLEAAMGFYGAPFRSAAKLPGAAGEIEARAATHQVPVLQTPENWMVADTTPILGLLDERFPMRRLFPAGPLGVLVHVLEEVLDEWIARTMVHYRWHHEENVVHVVSAILGREVDAAEAKAFPLAQWGPRACRATGTESEHQQRAVEAEYLALLDALEQQLGETAFSLGDRPSALDAILLGGLRAHTNNDPVPDLAGYPRCIAWDEVEADRWDGGGDLTPFPETTLFGDHVLALARDQYAPFALANAEALSQGAKAFSAVTYGESVSYLTRPYPEQSRRMIQARIRDRLDDWERRQVAAFLEERGLSKLFMPASS